MLLPKDCCVSIVKFVFGTWAVGVLFNLTGGSMDVDSFEDKCVHSHVVALGDIWVEVNISTLGISTGSNFKNSDVGVSTSVHISSQYASNAKLSE